jgi:hypothetical protein
VRIERVVLSSRAVLLLGDVVGHHVLHSILCAIFLLGNELLVLLTGKGLGDGSSTVNFFFESLHGQSPPMFIADLHLLDHSAVLLQLNLAFHHLFV